MIKPDTKIEYKSTTCLPYIIEITDSISATQKQHSNIFNKEIKIKRITIRHLKIRGFMRYHVENTINNIHVGKSDEK